MSLLAYDLALQLIRALRPTLAIIKRHDAKLATQVRDALTSIALNTAEARGRTGGDASHLFRVALGSLREVSAGLDIAVAYEWIPVAPEAALRDRLGGLLYGLQRR